MLALSLAFLVLSTRAGWAKAASPPRILQVEVRGNRNVSATAIMARIQSRVGQRVSGEVANGDIKRIYAMGCFEKVLVKAVPEAGKARGIKLVFNVVEKSTHGKAGCTR